MFGRQIFTPVWLWLATRISALWIRPSVLPEDPFGLIGRGQARVCYVLEYGRLADRLALQQVCARLGLPLPNAGLRYAGIDEPGAVIELRQLRGFFVGVPGPGLSERLTRLIEAGSAAGDDELLCVPVAIYWGRSPEREGGIAKLALSERWEIAGRTRKLFATFVHGRNTLVQFSTPLSVKAILDEKLAPARAVRKVSRILRVHFRQRRIATLGPDLSHRRNLVGRVLLAENVRAAISAQSGGESAEQEKLRREARDYAFEIAADYSHPTIRVLERLLSRVWNRLYAGIRLTGFERVQSIVEGNELIYVPCHRSHMDYLLLSYIIYHQGLSIPHIAAGINLNLPLIGPLLRRGGAFFLRRSFRGNRLYAEVFHAYLRELQSAGFPLEYFIEGGRSRTGRLLAPKGGMLSMSLASFLAEPERPVHFVPVYFGYEKMVEGRSFVGELSGQEKPRESLFALLRSLRKLRENFGQVYVSVGRPIDLQSFVEAHAPDWRESVGGAIAADAERSPWFGEVVDALGIEIMQRVNAAAAVSPVSLLALALLSMPRQSMPVADLRRQLELFVFLARELPYSGEISLPEESAEAIIAHGIELSVIHRESHPLGDLIAMNEDQAVLLTYFRNNILHLFAVHASVACVFMNGTKIAEDEIVRIAKLSYPFLRRELFMHWSESAFESAVRASIRAMERIGLLRAAADSGWIARPEGGTRESFQLLQLGQILVPVLQRYYMTIALLGRHGAGALTQAELERLCQLCAERLSIMYGLRSPDFFDRKLFQGFIRELRSRDVLRIDEQGKLHFENTLTQVRIDARRLLGEQIHHSIISVTAVDPEDLAAAASPDIAPVGG